LAHVHFGCFPVQMLYTLTCLMVFLDPFSYTHVCKLFSRLFPRPDFKNPQRTSSILSHVFVERLLRIGFSLFRVKFNNNLHRSYSKRHKVQGGSNMIGTICVQTSHSLSRSYLNHLVYVGIIIEFNKSGSRNSLQSKY
jgi:hypothetical protein